MEEFLSCAVRSERIDSVVSTEGDYDDTPLFTRRSANRIESDFPPEDKHKKFQIPERKIQVQTIIPPPPKEEEEPRESVVTKILLATALETVFLQLRVLDELNNELRIMKVKTGIDSDLIKKFGVEETPTPDLESQAHPDFNSNKSKLDKWVSDRKYVYDVLLGTYVELVLEGTFSTLTRANNEKIARKEYLQYLTDEVPRNKLIERDLSKQIRQKRIYYKSELYRLNSKIASIQAQLEDAPLLADIENRYVENWQLARTEQHLQIIADTEDAPTRAIKEYRQKYEMEARVHAEMEMAINLLITETLDNIEKWMVKYDTDLENIEVKIQVKIGDIQALTEKRQEMEKTLEKHQKEIEDWIQFKAARENERLHREKMAKAAITVQAWWRGLLVRLKLGPFKPKRKPKPKHKK